MTALTGIELTGRAAIALIALGALSGVVFGIHYQGRLYERKVIAKSAQKAEERKDKGVAAIEGIQAQTDPLVVTEKETIVKTDRQSAIELGRVKGELEALRDRYEKISSGDWGERPLPDVVRDEISEIDDVLSGL